jgi:hypothetical protein
MQARPLHGLRRHPSCIAARSSQDRPAIKYIPALERDRDRILTEAVQALATRGFDAQYHGGYWTVSQHSQASLIPDGAAERLRGWLSGEGP